jgi:hypothetical protein
MDNIYIPVTAIKSAPDSEDNRPHGHGGHDHGESESMPHLQLWHLPWPATEKSGSTSLI